MPGSIPVARVYDAFDAEAYRAFRAANRRSRGGTVLVADLLGGLAEIAPGALSVAFGMDLTSIADLARPPMIEADLVPMANEPALREVFMAAYQSAIERPVTAADLAEAIARQTNFIRIASQVREAPIDGSNEWTGEQAVTILEDWLAAQSLPPVERDVNVANLEIGRGSLICSPY